MCLSKRSPDSAQPSTTTSRPMEDSIRCPTGMGRCGDLYDERFCSRNGFCCQMEPIETVRFEESICVCFKTHEGRYCHTKSLTDESRERLERTGMIAAFSAILGVMVIALFITLIVLQVKYYRHRKKRILGDHEMDVISKPDIGRRDDDSKKESLRDQPGYSWRESVRHTAKKFRKFQEVSSRSVPDDLFKMGLTIALFGMKGTDQKNGSRGADPLNRCFSAEAGSGGGGERAVSKTPDRQLLTDKGDAEKADPAEKTEDTVR